MRVNRHGGVLFAKNIFRYIHLISPVTNFLVYLPQSQPFLSQINVDKQGSDTAVARA